MIDSETEIRIVKSLMDEIIQNSIAGIQRWRDGRVWNCALMINHRDMAGWGTRSGLSSQKVWELCGDGKNNAGIGTFGVTMLRKTNVSV